MAFRKLFKIKTVLITNYKLESVSLMSDGSCSTCGKGDKKVEWVDRPWFKRFKMLIGV